MKVGTGIFREIFPKILPTRENRKLFARLLKISPQALLELMGNWCTEIKPWRKNVDEFDRRLLGISGSKKIGLHFSLANWDMSVEQDPDLDALRAGTSGELHYVGVNPKAGLPQVLNLFPRWAGDGRNYLIVIDRENKRVRGIEAEQEISPLQRHIVIEAPPFSAIFYRAQWLIQEPIPLFSNLDFFRAEKMMPFVRFGFIYQSTWQQELEGKELYNFYLMLSAVTNGLRLLHALEGS